MGQVSFEEEKNLAPSSVRKPRRGLADLLVSSGFAPNTTVANIMLVVASIAIAAGAVAFFVINQPKPHVPTPAELESLRQMQGGDHIP